MGQLVEPPEAVMEVPDDTPANDADLLPLDSAGPAIILYEEEVADLESSGGALNQDLTEALLGLGMAYKSRGDYENAETAFRRALHNSRVNYGLYGEEQLPLLEPLIEVNSATGDLKDLEQTYHYLHWVSKRIYGANDVRMLPVIERIGRWQLSSLGADGEEFSFSRLAAANDLFHHAIRIIEANYGPNDPRLLQPLYGIVLTSYRVAIFLSQGGAVEEASPRAGAGQSTTQVTRQQALESARLREDTLLNAYIIGKKALERVVSIHDASPDLSVESDAMARVYLGDWYLLFNKWNSSQVAYSNAYQLLNGSGLAKEEVDRVFARPRSLPAMPFFEDAADPVVESKATNSAYVLMTFDVSASGRAKNIQIVESNPEDSISLRRRARSSVSSTKFRPRLENGTPVEQTGLSLRMVFDE